MTKQKSKNEVSTAQRRVWRIFHFEHRFEMDSYRRRGGLDYVRMFVTATTQDKSNESSGFIQQLTELEHFYPEMRDTLEGRFWRLCRLTATQEDWLRGYLLDAEQKPLTGLLKMPPRLASERSCGGEEQVILDPFCGSGTTCIAAKSMGINYIGIDNSQRQ